MWSHGWGCSHSGVTAPGTPGAQPYPSDLRSEGVHVSWALVVNLWQDQVGDSAEKGLEIDTVISLPFPSKQPQFYSGKQETQMKTTIPSLPFC